MNEIRQILMERDGISSEEADSLIQEASAALYAYLDAGDTDSAENICEEMFGLEPDYIMELL